MSFKYEDVEFRKEGNVAYIKLNRPEVFNAMSIPMMEGIEAALHDCDRDDAIGAVIMYGEGKAFCAGGDLKTMQENLKIIETLKVHLVDRVGDAIKAIRACSKPVIAQVHGPASGGGCSLALMCDFRIASEDAKFIESFVNVGLAPDSGGTYALSRLVGAGKLAELLMTAQPVKADEALSLGIVNKVFKREELAAETLKFAQLLASKPRDSIKTTKVMINNFMYNRLEEEIQMEKLFIRLLKRGADHREGVAAFAEKRTPEFNK